MLRAAPLFRSESHERLAGRSEHGVRGQDNRYQIQPRPAGIAVKDTVELHLREAAAGDEPAIRAVVFAVLREYGLQPDPADTDSDLRDVVSSYTKRGGCFRVLCSPANEIVGCGGLYPLDAQEAEIRKMYLLPRARGRGFGRALLHDLVERARAQGFRRVVLETASVLREAIGLYRRHGFEPLCRDHLASRCDQAYVLELASEKSLTGSLPGSTV